MSTTLQVTYGSNSTLTTTALATLGSSATVGWQSAGPSTSGLDNRSNKYPDFLVSVNVGTGAGSLVNKTVYVYAVPWYHDGTNWVCGGDTGTATNNLSDGAQAASITSASPNNLGMPLMQVAVPAASGSYFAEAKLSTRFGPVMPHAFQLFVINDTGLTLSTGVIKITPVTYVSA